MSVASGEQASTAEARHSRPAACYHKCISCGQRFWQKKVLARRAAKCRGMRYNPDGSRWVCRAWRCRYNDQCPGADTACPICGAYKPPEFMPTRHVSASSPASLSRSTSSVDPSLVPANQPPANSYTGILATPPYGHPDSSSQWMASVDDNVQSLGMNLPTVFADDLVVSDQQSYVPRRGSITHLPLYGNVIERYFTEV